MGMYDLPPEFRRFVESRGGAGATLTDDRQDFMIILLWNMWAELRGGAPPSVDGPVSASANPPFIKTGRIIVKTAGTAEQGPDIKVPPGFEVTLRAHKDNPGSVYIAGTPADAESHTSCVTLLKQETMPLKVSTLKNVYVDADANDYVVEFVVEQEETQ
jgi:hypothetical protein